MGKDGHATADGQVRLLTCKMRIKATMSLKTNDRALWHGASSPMVAHPQDGHASAAEGGGRAERSAGGVGLNPSRRLRPRAALTKMKMKARGIAGLSRGYERISLRSTKMAGRQARTNYQRLAAIFETGIEGLTD